MCILHWLDLIFISASFLHSNVCNFFFYIYIHVSNLKCKITYSKCFDLWLLRSWTITLLESNNYFLRRLCHPVWSQASLHNRSVCPGSTLLPGQLQNLIMISPKLIMDSSRNERWMSPFRKFSWVRVKITLLTNLFHLMYSFFFSCHGIFLTVIITMVTDILS